MFFMLFPALSKSISLSQQLTYPTGHRCRQFDRHGIAKLAHGLGPRTFKYEVVRESLNAS